MAANGADLEATKRATMAAIAGLASSSFALRVALVSGFGDGSRAWYRVVGRDGGRGWGAATGEQHANPRR